MKEARKKHGRSTEEAPINKQVHDKRGIAGSTNAYIYIGFSAMSSKPYNLHHHLGVQLYTWQDVQYCKLASQIA